MENSNKAPYIKKEKSTKYVNKNSNVINHLLTQFTCRNVIAFPHVLFFISGKGLKYYSQESGCAETGRLLLKSFKGLMI